MLSKVESARALFEQRIEKNIQHGEPQSKDFLSVVGRTSRRPRNLLATPRVQPRHKVGQQSPRTEDDDDSQCSPISTSRQRLKASAQPLCTKTSSPRAPKKVFLQAIASPPLMTMEEVQNQNVQEYTSTLTFDGNACESLPRIFSSEHDVDDDDDALADPRLLECLQTFDQSIRNANEKKLRAINRRGSLVQEVLGELDESLVNATKRLAAQQQQQPMPDTVLTLKPSAIRGRRARAGFSGTHNDSCSSPSGATAETCSMTSYAETVGSFESLFQQRKSAHTSGSNSSTSESVGKNYNNNKHLLKSYGFKRPPSPTSSNNSIVSKSSCSSTRSSRDSEVSSPKSSPLVAPSPSTLERHSQVRNSVLQGLRPAPFLEQADEKTISQETSLQKTALIEVDSSEEAEDVALASNHASTTATTTRPATELKIDQDDFPIHDEEECDSAPPSPVKCLVPPLSTSIRMDQDLFSVDIETEEDCDSRPAGLVLGLQPPGIPEKKATDEVHCGFGPMSPQRRRQHHPTFDLGFSSCYTTPQPLSTPAQSCCSPRELMDMQKSLLSLEDEDEDKESNAMDDNKREDEVVSKENEANNCDYVRKGVSPAINMETEATSPSATEAVAADEIECTGSASTGPIESAVDSVGETTGECSTEAVPGNIEPAACSSRGHASPGVEEHSFQYNFDRADLCEDTEASVDYGYESTSHRLNQAHEFPSSPRSRSITRSQSMTGDRSPRELVSVPRPRLSPRRQSLSMGGFIGTGNHQTRHHSMIGSSKPSGGISKYQTRHFSMSGTIGGETMLGSRRMSNPFISDQFMSSRQLMRARVTPLELNMKKTMIVARGMARRRGTLLHDIGALGRSTIPEELPHHINDKIKFSLKDLWKRRRRTAVEQEEIENKANKLFPKKKNSLARRVSFAAGSQVERAPGAKKRRRLSMSAILAESHLRYSFLEEFSALGEKVHRVAATRIQAQVRAYLGRARYRIKQLENRWAKIEYEKIQEISRIEKKNKARKKAHKKKTLKALDDIAEQAVKARKLTDHLKRENRKIKDQNARLQQLCFKLRKINGHMEKTIGIHNKNFRSMWEFVEKMKNKKRRIEDKVKRYEARIDQHTKNVEVVQKRIDAEMAHKDILIDTLQKLATTIAIKSSNVKLKVLVEMVAEGHPVDEELLDEIGDEEEDIDDEEFDLHKSFNHDVLCETFHKSFAMEDDEETVDEGFLLALSMDDNSTISDVSSVYSDMEDTSFTNGGYGDDGTSVYEEVLVDDDDDHDDDVGHSQRLVEEGREEIIEEIIEEVISDDEYVFEEVLVTDDEDEDEDDAFSCQSSVYVDQGSIIM